MIQLRELARSDLQYVNRWRQNRSLTDGLGAPFRYIGPEVDSMWFDRYVTRRGTDVRCVICLDDSPEPVGLVSLTGIDPVHRHGEFHILLGDSVKHGEGFGTEATRVMVRHAFDDLNLNRVFLHVLTTNHAAIRVYEKVGFVREGILRQAVFKHGEYADLLVMGILRTEVRST